MSLRIRFPGLARSGFRVFISYAREQQPIAELLAHTLEHEGFDAFFDAHDLPAGEAYTARIRTALNRADLFVFLISPESVTPPSYALTELGMALDRWGPTGNRVLGVMVRDTPSDAVPPPLRVITWLQPRGDTVAEITNAVARLHRRRLRRRMTVTGAAVAAMTLGGAAVYAGWGRDCTGAVVAHARAAAARDGAHDRMDAGASADAVRFHLSEAARYLGARRWTARAERFATANILYIRDDHWLDGPGITRAPRSGPPGTPIAPERGVFSSTGGAGNDGQGAAGGDTSGGRAHVVIHRDGTVTQFAPFDRSTAHTERSDTANPGQRIRPSIAIYLDNRGALQETDDTLPAGVHPAMVVSAPDRNHRPARWESYTEAQLFRAIQIAHFLNQKYGLAELLGHHEVPAAMDMDPGPVFPLPLITTAVFSDRESELGPAAVSYARALALDPENADARKGLDEVAKSYAILANERLAARDGEDAAFYIDGLASLDPCDRQLDDLRRRLRRL